MSTNNFPNGSFSSPNPGASQWGHLSEAVLRRMGFSSYLDTPPLKLTMITDKADQGQATSLMMRTTLAGERFMELKPVIVRPRALEQRFFDVEAIHQAAMIEKESAETTGLSLLVLLCKTEPVDLVLGIGEQGEALVADLKREAAKMYPNQVQKFVTQTELEQAARGRPFAGEPNAWLLVAFERLYKTEIAT